MDASRNVYLAGQNHLDRLPDRLAARQRRQREHRRLRDEESTPPGRACLGHLPGRRGRGLRAQPGARPQRQRLRGGRTESFSFPVPGGFDTSRGGTSDAFITKIAAAGSSLLWSSYLGGSSTETGYDVASDGAGAAYVVGETASSTFPVSGGFNATYNGSGDAFVTKISAAGTITWSSFLAGTGASAMDGAYSVAVDPSQAVYVGGFTYSTTFPSTGGFDTTFGGVRDGFVTKVNATGASLAWSTYVGGRTGRPVCRTWWPTAPASTASRSPPRRTSAPPAGSISPTTASTTRTSSRSTPVARSPGPRSWAAPAMTAAPDRPRTPGGRVYVTGQTYSTNFPSTGGFDSTIGGTEDAFVAQINATGSALLWSSYLGGTNTESGSAVAADGSGNVYVAGLTASSNFPATGGFDPSRRHHGRLRGQDRLGPHLAAGRRGERRRGGGHRRPGLQRRHLRQLERLQRPGVGHLRVRVGHRHPPIGTEVQGFTSVGTATSATRTGLSLTSGVTYFVTVRAFNGSGISIEIDSDGVLVDATAPTAGTVNDGTAADVDLQTSTHHLRQLSGFADPQSGVARYEWASGRPWAGRTCGPSRRWARRRRPPPTRSRSPAAPPTRHRARHQRLGPDRHRLVGRGEGGRHAAGQGR